MPRVEEIRAYLSELAPQQLAESWDNVGTLVDCGGNITSVLTALDITDETVNEAEMAGCQLIVSHHPVIFHPLKSVDSTQPAYRMIKKNISGINKIITQCGGKYKSVEIFASAGNVI